MVPFIKMIRYLNSYNIDIRYDKIKDINIIAYFDQAKPNTITLNHYLFATYRPEASRFEWATFVLAHELAHYFQHKSGYFTKVLNEMGEAQGTYFLDIDADLKAIDLCNQFGILKAERFSTYLKNQLKVSSIEDIKNYYERERNRFINTR
jgi:Zn-dependent peptidase ImmA (M78 family)